MKQHSKIRSKLALGILVAFVLNVVIGPVAPVLAQTPVPLPTAMVNLSSGYAPTLIKGLRVYPDNPLRFDFIVDSGESRLQDEDLELESMKLMKYFLSSLTVPEKDLWVNLSPYEKDRIIPDAFSQTEMGRDMLAQDYILKQLTSTLIYPDDKLGKSFWEKVYKKAYEMYGTTDVPVNTFNKIWIVPQKAVVFAKNNIAYVVDSHLQVMLEEDYIALQNNQLVSTTKVKDVNAIGSQIIREIVLPAIEKDVNEGKNFVKLRQVYNSLILATWFKRNLKESILGKVYVGQNKVDGVTFSDRINKEQIYEEYLQAFKKGAYNLIKEEEDPYSHEIIPRKYFSGGIEMAQNINDVLEVTASSSIFYSKFGSNSSPPDTQFGERSTIRDQLHLIAVNLHLAAPRTTPAASRVDATPVASGDFSLRYSSYQTPQVILSSNMKPRDRVADGFQDIGDSKAAIKSFRDALSTYSNEGGNDVNVLGALRMIMPLAKYMLETLKVNPADAGKYSEFISLFLRGEKNRNQEIQSELLSKTLQLAGALTDEQVSQLIEDAMGNAKVFLLSRFLMGDARKVSDWDQVKVNFVLNAPEIFTLKNSPDGKIEVDVDLMAFLVFSDDVQTLAWDYSFSRQQREARIKDVEEFFRSKNFQVVNSSKIVVEILRILVYMENVVDPYFGVGANPVSTDEDELVSQRKEFLTSLGLDGGNRYLVRLFEAMGAFTTVSQSPDSKAIKLPDTEQRILEILKYLADSAQMRPALYLEMKNAGGASDYLADDLAAIKVYYAEKVKPNAKEWIGGPAQVLSVTQPAAVVPSVPVQTTVTESFPAKSVAPPRPTTLVLGPEDRSIKKILESVYGEATKDNLKDFFIRNPRIKINDDLHPGMKVNALTVTMTVGANEMTSLEVFKFLYGRVTVTEFLGFKEINGINAAARFSTGMTVKAELSPEQVLDLKQRLQAQENPPGITVDAILGSSDTSASKVFFSLYGPEGTAAEFRDFKERNSIGADTTFSPGMVVTANLTPGRAQAGNDQQSPVAQAQTANPTPSDSSKAETVTLTLSAKYTSIKRILDIFYGEATSGKLAEFLQQNPKIKVNSDLRPGMMVTARVTSEQKSEMYKRQMTFELDDKGSKDTPKDDGWDFNASGVLNSGFFDSSFDDAPARNPIISKVKRWALGGAIAVMGLFSLGHLMDINISTLMDRINPSATVEVKAPQLKLDSESLTPKVAIESQRSAIVTVKEGDTLSDIAYRAGLNPVSGPLAIAAVNPSIANIHMIHPEQVITIPNVQAVTITVEKAGPVNDVVKLAFGEVTSQTFTSLFAQNPDVSIIGQVKAGTKIHVMMPNSKVEELVKRLNDAKSLPNKVVIGDYQFLQERFPAIVEPQVPSSLAINNNANNSSNPVGGINLDPSGLEISTEGDSFQFNVPVDTQMLENLERDPVNGFVPVIINVVPIINLPQFLGVNKSSSSPEPLALAK